MPETEIGNVAITGDRIQKPDPETPPLPEIGVPLSSSPFCAPGIGVIVFPVVAEVVSCII